MLFLLLTQTCHIECESISKVVRMLRGFLLSQFSCEKYPNFVYLLGHKELKVNLCNIMDKNDVDKFGNFFSPISKKQK